jgi:hypothetical protein
MELGLARFSLCVGVLGRDGYEHLSSISAVWSLPVDRWNAGIFLLCGSVGDVGDWVVCYTVNMKQPNTATLARVYAMVFAKVYPMYIAKAEKKGRTKAEVDKIICWLTGYTPKGLTAQVKKEADFEKFFKAAPKLNPARKLITGVVCGVRVEEVEDSIMREVRYLDKLVDELAKGRPMEKILRQ